MANEVKVMNKNNAQADRICKELGCKKLYINTKGEYFTEYTYAVSSEDGDKSKVVAYTAGTMSAVATPAKETAGGKVTAANRKSPSAEKEEPVKEKKAPGQVDNLENKESDEQQG